MGENSDAAKHPQCTGQTSVPLPQQRVIQPSGAKVKKFWVGTGKNRELEGQSDNRMTDFSSCTGKEVEGW